VLDAVQLISRSDDFISLTNDPDVTLRLLRERASASIPVETVREYWSSATSPNGDDAGEAVAKRLGMNWAQGSRRRYGNALLVWLHWLTGVGKRDRRGARAKYKPWSGSGDSKP